MIQCAQILVCVFLFSFSYVIAHLYVLVVKLVLFFKNKFYFYLISLKSIGQFDNMMFS